MYYGRGRGLCRLLEIYQCTGCLVVAVEEACVVRGRLDVRRLHDDTTAVEPAIAIKDSSRGKATDEHDQKNLFEFHSRSCFV